MARTNKTIKANKTTRGTKTIKTHQKLTKGLIRDKLTRSWWSRVPKSMVIFVAIFALLGSGLYVVSRAEVPGDPTKFGMNADGVWCILNWDSSGRADPCPRAEAIARLDDMKSMGVKWIRFDYPWPSIQNCGQSCAPSKWNWEPWDDFVREAHARGFKVLVDLPYIPDWAKPLSKEQLSDYFGQYAKAVAQHFKDNAKNLNGEVQFYELGNEENLAYPWEGTRYKGTDLPEIVARKNYAGYKAIKTVNSNFKVLSSFSGSQCQTNFTADIPCEGNTNSWDIVNFLRAFYKKVDQLRPSIAPDFDTNHMYDALSAHPYCWAGALPIGQEPGVCPWNGMIGSGKVSAHDYSQYTLRGLLDAHGESHKQIWATETGYLWLNNGNRVRDQQRQADSLSFVYKYIQQHPEDYGPAFWYSYKNWPDPKGEQWGMYDGNNAKARGNPLPAYSAYKNAATAAGKADKDSQPPSNVAIVAPEYNSTVSGIQVVMSASATDNIGVKKVEYYRLIPGGKQYLGAAQPSGYGYIYYYDSTTTTDGWNSYMVRAYDEAGNFTDSRSFQINIANKPEEKDKDDVSPPSAYIAVPATNTVLSGQSVFSSGATDNVGVVKVEYIVTSGGDVDKVIGQGVPSLYGYIFTWDTTKVLNGNYSVKARAQDAAGNIGYSDPLRVSVNNATTDTQPPSSPKSLSITINSNTSATLKWQASNDTSGISHYNIYVGGQVVGKTSGLSYALANLQPSTRYNVSVLAVDGAGIESLPSNISFRTPRWGKFVYWWL